MYSMISTATLRGIESIDVFVEADVGEGMPLFEMVGFLSAEVKEAKERVRTALKNSGYLLPAKRITINLSPANLRKSGSGFDLPIAIAILTALGIVQQVRVQNILMVGEIGLNGDVLSMNGVLPILAEAKERGYVKCIIPWKNRKEAGLVPGIEIVPVKHLNEAIAYLCGETLYTENELEMTDCGRENATGKLDFDQMNGQAFLKRACEVAVAGKHNLLMIGPPGSGKTMAAQRIPTILPPMTEEEKMELSKIYSICGLFDEKNELLEERPFRSPHHTITPQGLTGGGAIPKPGEMSLAHCGVLFLDELAEFQKSTLEVMRQPLEDKTVKLVRVFGTYKYPADFMLLAAMNPCSCGYYPDMQKCRCTQSMIHRYLGRISQPLLDRIDMCVEAPRVKYEELVNRQINESSAVIRERVVAAHEIQKARFRGTTIRFNSQIPAEQIRIYCELGPKKEKFMKEIYKSMNLTARTYHKILKVARTIADLDGCETIEQSHLNEAVCYRNVDKKYWERME